MLLLSKYYFRRTEAQDLQLVTHIDEFDILVVEATLLHLKSFQTLP